MRIRSSGSSGMRKGGVLFLLVTVSFSLTSCQRSSAPAPIEVNHGVVGGQAYDLDLENISQSPPSAVKKQAPSYSKRQLKTTSHKPTARRPDFIIVEDGQTLYSIASQYKMSGAEIITINHLQAPYRLKNGQKLYLNKLAAPKAKPRPSLLRKASPSPSADTFIWPVQGRVISAYGNQGNEGINIAAPLNTPVTATQSGKVSYVGSDLEDFGTLVLINHKDEWKSAYAHLNRASVQPGDQVTRGQVIGYIGQSGSVSSPQLHLEIRHGAESVNPKKIIQ